MWKALNMLLAIICPIIVGIVGLAIIYEGHNKIEGFILVVMTLYYFNLRVVARNRDYGAWWL